MPDSASRPRSIHPDGPLCSGVRMHGARTLSIAEPRQTMTVDRPLQISQMGWRGRNLGVQHRGAPAAAPPAHPDSATGPSGCHERAGHTCRPGRHLHRPRCPSQPVAADECHAAAPPNPTRCRPDSPPPSASLRADTPLSPRSESASKIRISRSIAVAWSRPAALATTHLTIRRRPEPTGHRNHSDSAFLQPANQSATEQTRVRSPTARPANPQAAPQASECGESGQPFRSPEVVPEGGSHQFGEVEFRPERDELRDDFIHRLHKPLNERAPSMADSGAELRMSRVPWNFGGGPVSIRLRSSGDHRTRW